MQFKGNNKKTKAAKPKPSADQKLKDKASTDKSKARAAAAKNTELQAGLVNNLKAIDTALDADRRELAAMVVKLPWPAANTLLKAKPERTVGTSGIGGAPLQRST